jgi:hypothetical protein
MADEKMVKVTLRNTVGLRGAGAGKYAGRLYGPGEVEIPQEVAERLGLTGSAARRGGGEDLDGMTVEELKERADAQGIEVKGSGADGRPVKDDYVKALKKAK